jgi:hypothetical protein
MPAGKLIFAQLTEWIHPEQFRRCVARYDGNYKVYNFPCWDQFLAMSFAQITYRDSLADMEVCLRWRQDQLYRLGFHATIARSTLADANASRDLAHLSRFGAVVDRPGPPSLCQRIVWRGIGANRLRAGLDHD